MHFACDGSGRNYNNTRLVHELIKCRVPIEAKDAQGNTPYLLAAGQGLTDVVLLLLQAGTYKNETNFSGVGALQRAWYSSTSLYKECELDGR